MLLMNEALEDVRLIMDDSDAWLPLGDDASESRRPSTDCASRCADPDRAPLTADPFSLSPPAVANSLMPVVFAFVLLLLFATNGNLHVTLMLQCWRAVDVPTNSTCTPR